MGLPKNLSMVVLALFMLGAASAVTKAQGLVKPPQDSGMQVVHSYQNDVSLPLYYLPAWAGKADEEGREGPENPKLPNNHIDSADPVVQHMLAPQLQMPASILNFDGIPFPGVGCSCAPPDTNGEVGETQYVQMVNEGFQVFSKATGASVLGPQSISSLWAGFGGVCETAGNGDPVVLYDQLAKRWLISQFAGSGVPTDECIAVSTTSDATGTWFRYGFHLGTNFFDYPHLGVWPDGYYMSMNVFNAAGTAFLGPQAFVFDRSSMLLGTPATFITPGVTGGAAEDSFLPADLDGSILPPLNAPETFVEFPGAGTYKTWHFHTDFAIPANSTFTLFASPAAAGFTALCSSSRACVPQLGGTGTDSLDGIGDRLMFRLAYRNFGDHEALVGNYTVSSAAVAGVRWFELRNVTAGPVTVFQESTFQPDTDWRWMGSVAMDVVGDIAMGYSASSATINPQLRYAGRLPSDPPNTLAQGEAHLFNGTGSQTGTGNRWGDYSALTIDPVDDCTFWYTSEYYSTTGTFNWRTRIGNFKFPGCSLTPGFTLAATPASVSVCAGTPANLTINVGQTSGFNSPVTLAATGNPAPTTVTFGTNPVTPLPGSSTLQIGNTAGVAANTYPIQVNGTATGAANQSTTVNLLVFTATPPSASLVAPANGAINQLQRPAFSWTGSNTQTYTIDVATDPAFSNIVFTQVVTGTTVTPNVDLASNTTYYWSITATNACGSAAVSATFSFSTLPLPGDCSVGTTPQTVYSYGFESGLNGWTLGGGGVGTNTWADNPTAHSGAHSWKANDPASVTDQRFVSPPIVLPSGQNPVTLQFWHKRDMENNGTTACYDGGILEVSTNAGATWTQMGAPDLQTDPYTGAISSSFSNPLAGLQGWCNVQDWKNSIVDVSMFGGQTTQFRYRLGSDSSVSRDGWYLDDVKVQSCAVASHVVTPSVGTPAGSISPNTPQTVANNATTAFTLTPNANNHIVNVTGTCGGTLVGNTFTTAAVTADCTVIANFALNTFTVTPSVTGNGAIAPNTPQTVNSGATTAFTLTPNANNHIVNVTGTCGGSLVGTTFTTAAVTANCTVIANFAVNTFTVTPSVTGSGAISPNTPQSVNFSATTAFTLTPNAGNHVVNVTGTCGGTLLGSTFTTNAIRANCTVIANFAIDTVSFTVTPSVTGNGAIAPNTPQSVNSGATTAFTLTPNANNHVANVTGTCGGALVGNIFTTAAVTADCTVIANFAIDTHTVTANAAGGNGTITPPSQTVNHGSAANFVVTPVAGYHVASVTGSTCTVSQAVGNNWVSNAITANCSVTAIFAIDRFTVTASVSGGNGTITPPSQLVDSGSTAAFVVTPASGYHAASVTGTTCTVTQGVGNNWTSSAISANCTVTATFALNVLVYTTQPADVTRGHALGTVVVTEQDGSGNTINDNASVHFTIAACSGSVDLGSVVMVNGVATLNNTLLFYTLTSPPGSQINATTPALSAISTFFNVLANPDLMFADGYDGCRL